MGRPQPTEANGAERSGRKQRGDFPTPPELVDLVVENTLAPVRVGQRVAILDPACGDGRFLVAAGRHVRAAGGEPDLHGVEVHPATLVAARRALAEAGLPARIEPGDALARGWEDGGYDAVVGNPPYLSQLAAATTRGRASVHGGGPYADAAAEFLALAMRLARPDGGRVGFVLPQSILASRDAGPIREAIDRVATMRWSWWSPRRMFDAEVTVCALAFERSPTGAGDGPGDRPPEPWSRVVARALGVPHLPPLRTAGTLGDRARTSADFRDQYYGLVGTVVDDAEDAATGPPLVTSGSIDPARCGWGRRPVRFHGQRYDRPRVQLAALSPKMRRWADDLLVPKVLVANQTTVVEALADPAGRLLPAVPVLSVRPIDATLVLPIAAVLTSAVASGWAWHRAAGTGLSARALRLGPRWLGELPWPAGDLADAVAAYERGDVVACAAAVQRAYGVGDTGPGAALAVWWKSSLPDRVEPPDPVGAMPDSPG